MIAKHETRNHIISFVHYVETQFNKKVKILLSDNGYGFSMVTFFNEKGIIHHTYCV